MRYGICNLSIVALRAESSHSSELTSQILYGETFKVLDCQKFWSRVRLDYDKFEGWVSNNQYLEIDEVDYNGLQLLSNCYSEDLVEFIQGAATGLMTIPLGASLRSLQYLNHKFDGQMVKGQKDKSNLVNTSYNYLNVPYLMGGKTPFGIDNAGFTQMVYMLNGYQLLRTAQSQSTQGTALSFIEESEPGDLAFFDDNEGVITHVGIIMKDNYIIHVDGKVRMDRLDHSGIYNVDRNIHTHKLRVIKKIV